MVKLVGFGLDLYQILLWMLKPELHDVPIYFSGRLVSWGVLC